MLAVVPVLSHHRRHTRLQHRVSRTLPELLALRFLVSTPQIRDSGTERGVITAELIPQPVPIAGRRFGQLQNDAQRVFFQFSIHDS